MGLGALGATVRKYSVTIIMVPLLAGCHYGWMKLQEIDTLVTPNERKDLPIFIMAKKIISSFTEPKEKK